MRIARRSLSRFRQGHRSACQQTADHGHAAGRSSLQAAQNEDLCHIRHSRNPFAWLRRPCARSPTDWFYVQRLSPKTSRRQYDDWRSVIIVPHAEIHVSVLSTQAELGTPMPSPLSRSFLCFSIYLSLSLSLLSLLWSVRVTHMNTLTLLQTHTTHAYQSSHPKTLLIPFALICFLLLKDSWPHFNHADFSC